VLGEVEALLARGPEADVVLLPEACITGYVAPDLTCDLRRFAEPVDGETSSRLAALARRHRTHLVGPLIVEDEGRAYNAMAVFDPGGRRVATYRKRHPWYVETWATPGEAPVACFSIREVRFAMAICFDVHFLQAESAAELDEADALLFPSAWVDKDDSRAELFSRLTQEHGLTVINANWGVGVPRILGQGSSRIVDRSGVTSAIVHGVGPERIEGVVRRKTV
jgi:predicted amidohydrolase